MPTEKNPPTPNRRHFLAGFAAALAGILPPLSGLGVLLNPLRKKSPRGQFIHVAPLSALPADGVPRRFPIVTNHADAWNHFSNVPIGAVFLWRTGETAVQAFTVTCPHAGCSVEYRSTEKDYLCPCHNSRFNLDGTVQDPASPSPRGLDALEVDAGKLQNRSEVWVRFQKFQAGKPKKQAV